MDLLARGRGVYERLGRLAARAGDEEARVAYVRLFATAMLRPIQRGRDADAMHHLAGRLRGVASDEDRAAMRAMIEAYRTGALSDRSVVLARLRALLAEDAWARRQTFLSPGP